MGPHQSGLPVPSLHSLALLAQRDFLLQKTVTGGWRKTLQSTGRKRRPAALGINMI